MNISIVTLFSELYQPFLQTSLFKKATEKGLLSFSVKTLFEYVQPKERIDGPTFGHNSGMLLRSEVIERAVDDLDGKFGKSFKIFLSPQGTKLTQTVSKELWQKISDQKHIMIVAGRYEGIDARAEAVYADAIISVGDFVLMGGDIPAMVVMEAVFRHMPGIVGKQESVDLDSFSGSLVDYPEYTKPVEWKGLVVPEVLRSGDHKAIEIWRKEQAVELTVKKHFDWLRSNFLPDHDKDLANKFIPEHFVALLHSGVYLKDGRVGTTSVTSIDLHDIARSAATYNVKDYFVVTPLIDQQKIVKTILDFWQEKESGIEYNKHRHEAISRVHVVEQLENAIEKIEKKCGKKPIIIGTSARFEHGEKKMISYHDQTKVWAHDRPVLILLGTGHGMGQELMDKCDYFLAPLQGFSKFNHLSVRSAAAIIFDKWLGFDLQR
jgi:tRNA (guanine37-N1)-methyltransferase